MIDFVASAHDRAVVPALKKSPKNAVVARTVRDAARRPSPSSDRLAPTTAPVPPHTYSPAHVPPVRPTPLKLRLCPSFPVVPCSQSSSPPPAAAFRVKGADVAEVNVKSDATPVTAKAARQDGRRVLTAATRFTISEKDHVPPPRSTPPATARPAAAPKSASPPSTALCPCGSPQKQPDLRLFFGAPRAAAAGPRTACPHRFPGAAQPPPASSASAPQNKQNCAFPFAQKNLRSSVPQRPTTTTLCCPLSLSSSFSPPLWPRIPARPEPTTGKTNGSG